METSGGMRALKVWGGSWDGRSRGIVAARTKKRAVELLAAHYHPMSRHYFDGYWCETGNDMELKIANREGVWVTTNRLMDGSYKPVPLKTEAA